MRNEKRYFSLALTSVQRFLLYRSSHRSVLSYRQQSLVTLPGSDLFHVPSSDTQNSTFGTLALFISDIFIAKLRCGAFGYLFRNTSLWCFRIFSFSRTSWPFATQGRTGSRLFSCQQHPTAKRPTSKSNVPTHAPFSFIRVRASFGTCTPRRKHTTLTNDKLKN